MSDYERIQKDCQHLYNAMEPKLLGVGYRARCIHCGKIVFIDLSKRAKNTEQLLQPDNGYCNPETEEPFRYTPLQVKQMLG